MQYDFLFGTRHGIENNKRQNVKECFQFLKQDYKHFISKHQAFHTRYFFFPVTELIFFSQVLLWNIQKGFADDKTYLESKVTFLTGVLLHLPG